ncbi:MAG TPA: NAD-dependent epimerase/dehydratase family protein [Myxococcaceae bacterium]|nr:NAD-dependent epimerase/dehydratase family protein [Myxococcaceae bacterium]
MSGGTTVVTGATGFLGARICRELVDRGERVLAMGRNFSRFEVNHPLCARAVADLDDEAALDDACRGADAVIHSAALSTPWGLRRDFQRVNVAGTERLLRCAARGGVRRFVHVSSSSVTFDNKDRFGVTEAIPRATRFLSFYSESKADAEDAVRRRRDLETVIVRPRAIFGPGDTSLLPRLLRLAREGGLRVIGDGTNLQDLTYVDNVVDSLLLARDVPLAAGKTYFITNDDPVPLWDLIKQFLVAMGVPAPKRRVPLGVAYAAAASLEWLHRSMPRLGEPKLTRYTVALLGRAQTFDIRAAKEELGYRPRVSMAEALSRTVGYFQRYADA